MAKKINKMNKTKRGGPYDMFKFLYGFKLQSWQQKIFDIVKDMDKKRLVLWPLRFGKQNLYLWFYRYRFVTLLNNKKDVTPSIPPTPHNKDIISFDEIAKAAHNYMIKIKQSKHEDKK